MRVEALKDLNTTKKRACALTHTHTHTQRRNMKGFSNRIKFQVCVPADMHPNICVCLSVCRAAKYDGMLPNQMRLPAEQRSSTDRE